MSQDGDKKAHGLTEGQRHPATATQARSEELDASSRGQQATQPASEALQFAHENLGNTWVLCAMAGGGAALESGLREQVTHQLSGVVAERGGGLGSNQAMLRLMRRGVQSDNAASEPALSGGAPLPQVVRARVEAAFGRDFSHVRVHLDPAAARQAGAYSAQAFTIGSHIYFGAGEWAPGTVEGDRLLLHELTHVVQHDTGRLAGLQGLSSPDDPLEREAYHSEDALLNRLEPVSESAAPSSQPQDEHAAGEAEVTPQASAPVQRSEDGADKESARKKIDEIMQHLREGKWDVDSLAAKLSLQEMSYLKESERVAILSDVASGYSVQNEDERTVLNLLKSTRDPNAMIAQLQATDAKLLRTVVGALDFDEQRELHSVLGALKFASMSPAEASAAMDSAPTFPWADPGLIGALYNRRFYYEICELTPKGKLRVKFWSNFLFMGIPYQEVLLDPFELIRVYFAYPEAEVGAEEGQFKFMPAINLYGLVQKQFKQELSLTVDLLLLATGVGGVIGAASKAGKLIAALEVIFAASDIVIREHRSSLAKSKEGKDFLAVWDKVSMLMLVYGGARILKELPGLVKDLKGAWSRFRRTRGDDLDPTGLNSVEKQLDDIVHQSKRIDAIEGLDDQTRSLLAACPEEELNQIADLLMKHPEDASDILEQLAIKAQKNDDVLALSPGNTTVADELKSSLDMVTKVRTRGFPNGFGSLEEFKGFGEKLKQALKGHGIPADDVAVHGSSIRVAKPGDIDVAVLVDQATFDSLVEVFKKSTTKDRIRSLIIKEAEKGKIPSFLFPRTGGATVAQSVYGAAGELKVQVSLILKGGSFDIGPYLGL